MAEVSIDVGGSHIGMSAIQEAAVSWGTSSLLHVGLGLILLAGMYAVGKQMPRVDEGRVVPVMVSSDMDAPLYRGEKDSNTARPPLQDLIKGKFAGIDLAGTIDGAPNVVGGGIKGLSPVDFIGSGIGGTLGRGTGDRDAVGNGVGLIPSFGPRQTLFKQPLPAGRAPHKIVFVLDHSGSMIDSFDYLREEVKRVVKGYTPVQQFAVIMFSETVDVLGPEGLQRALPRTQRELYERLDGVRAGGRNDDLLEPFSKAFGKAFAMKPEVIVFLTDGKFDPRLPTVVAGMNKDKSVKINTIAFVKIDPGSEEQLRAIAADNAGNYRFVSREDLGR